MLGARTGYGLYRTRGCSRLSPACFSGQYGRYARDAADVSDNLFGGKAKLFQLLGAVGRDRYREIRMVIFNEDLGHEAEINDIVFEVRAFDPTQGGEHLCLIDWH
jgi:hypothetical protein